MSDPESGESSGPAKTGPTETGGPVSANGEPAQPANISPVDQQRRTPEQIAAVWAQLDARAAQIDDAETRAQYLAKWRGRYEAEFPRWLSDTSIVSLPDWKHLGEITGKERRAAKKVSDAWVDGASIDTGDADAVKRHSWELGRRVAARLLDEAGAAAAMPQDAPLDMDAFARGNRADLGEALLALIVLDLRCAVLDRNEDGLAQRFTLRCGQDFRHTTAAGWLRWDGKRWKLLEEEPREICAELLAAARETVRAIGREAAALRATGIDAGSIPEGADDKFRVEVDGVKLGLAALDIDDEGLDRIAMTASTCRLASGQLAAWGKAMGELKRYKSMVNIARSKLTVRVQEFDIDPFAINCQNGTLRLLRHVEADGRVWAEARLDPHSRSDLLTKIAAVPYLPEAACQNYDGTLDWAQEKPEMRRYIHQWGGYNLTGDMGAQIFHMWWGPLAQNGKSTLLDAWADCAGDYAAAGKIETFMEAASARTGDAATPALAKLPGVRMLRTGEPPVNAKFDESLINTITGQDTLLIRDNFRSFYEVKMAFKLTVACNAQPSIPNGTEGIRRRIKVVRFDKTMKNAVKPDGTPLRDENFKLKLVPELPGIFARLVQGALDWMVHGFIEPQDVTAATDEYKDENDPLGRFLAFCVEIDPASRVQAKPLYDLFVAWSKATGGPEWSMPGFKKKMVAKGYSSKASNGMQWLGLRAVRVVRDFVDENGNVIDLSGLTEAAPASAPPAAPPPPATGQSGGSSDVEGWLPPHFDDDLPPDWD